jgi:membrane dipeptidase
MRFLFCDHTRTGARLTRTAVSAHACSFDSPLARAKYLQQNSPLVDGHNDLPWALRQLLNNNLTAINLDQVQSGTSRLSRRSH